VLERVEIGVEVFEFSSLFSVGKTKGTVSKLLGSNSGIFSLK